MSPTMQAAIETLSAEDRVSLLEYLERTTIRDDVFLTGEQIALIKNRDAEMEADPSLGIPAPEFMADLRARWA